VKLFIAFEELILYFLTFEKAKKKHATYVDGGRVKAGSSYTS
jgi:hypothetical protein